MIRMLLLGGAAALTLSTVALAQSMPSMSAPPMGASSEALPTPDFLTAAAQSDQFEIKEGRLAETRGQSARVRQLGAMMVSAHSQTTAAMKAAAHKAGMPPMAPPGLDAGQQQMLSQLSALHGAAFDKMYVQQQLQAHQKALGVISAYAQNGPAGPIRNAAAKTVPIVQSHIAKFQALQSSMG